LAAVIVVAGIALALHPLARHYTQKALDQLADYRATFDDATVSIVPIRYQITNLTLQERRRPREKNPILHVQRVQVTLSGEELLYRAILVLKVEVNRPKLTLVLEHKKDQPAARAFNLVQVLSQFVPLRIDQIKVKRAELVYTDQTEVMHPKIWIHDVDATLDSLATRSALGRGEPTMLALTGTVQKTGQLSVFATTNPLEKTLTFSGRAELRGLQMADLHDFLSSKAQLKMPRSELDVFATFYASKGSITGGVKPVLKHPEVQPTESDLGDRLKAALADTGLKLFSDRIPGRDAVATIIPIKGTLGQPEPQLWPTIFGAIRNSFVEGVSEGFARIPPQTARKPESVLTQARKALSKHEKPEAQPTPAEEKRNEKKARE